MSTVYFLFCLFFLVIPNLIGNPGIFSEVFSSVKRQSRGIMLPSWLRPVRMGLRRPKKVLKKLNLV